MLLKRSTAPISWTFITNDTDSLPKTKGRYLVAITDGAWEFVDFAYFDPHPTGRRRLLPWKVAGMSCEYANSDVLVAWAEVPAHPNEV